MMISAKTKEEEEDREGKATIFKHCSKASDRTRQKMHLERCSFQPVGLAVLFLAASLWHGSTHC